jgi:hypothetical protein
MSSPLFINLPSTVSCDSSSCSRDCVYALCVVTCRIVSHVKRLNDRFSHRLTVQVVGVPQTVSCYKSTNHLDGKWILLWTLLLESHEFSSLGDFKHLSFELRSISSSTLWMCEPDSWISWMTEDECADKTPFDWFSSLILSNHSWEQIPDDEYVLSPSPKNLSDESQKENMETFLLKEYSKQKSPKSPRISDSNQRKNGKHGGLLTVYFIVSDIAPSVWLGSSIFSTTVQSIRHIGECLHESPR